MNNYSLDIEVLNNQHNLIQLTVNNLTKTVVSDWRLTLDFARFIEPSSMSKGRVVQVGTYTVITPTESDVILAGSYYQVTFNIHSAALSNYECGVREAYLSSALDNFITHHHMLVLPITLQLTEQKLVDKITLEPAEVSIIPSVNKLLLNTSEFVFDESLVYCCHSHFAFAAAHWLTEELSYVTQLTSVNDDQINDKQKILELNAKSSLIEGEYQILITASKVVIDASSQSGFIHAAATLLQLVKRTCKGRYQLDCVLINDKPRFAYRGLMLDCARHFHSIASIKRLINQMAHFKLNYFHWHLTDDEGWRLQIKAFPELTEIGAWRGPCTVLVPQFSHLNQKYGGFYTQQEVKKIIAYASQRGITIIPEIDIPGHCRAAIKSLPQLLIDPDDLSQYRSIQGYTDNVLSPALAGTYTFLNAVIDEVCHLFPSPYIHIGADEVPKGVWKKSPKCQKLMAEQGYNEEIELQGHLLRHVEKRINKQGKRMFGWEEVKLGGKVSQKTVICSWTTEATALEALKEGFDLLLQPCEYTYFDLVQDFSPDEFGVDWAGCLPLQQAYQYQPLTQIEEGDPLRKHILGVQCALWSEVVLSEARIDHMLFPRLLAHAEVAWSAAMDNNWNDFCARLQGQKQYFERNKINYRRF